MMDTRILARDFTYLAPATLEEALTILNENEGVYVLAGGTDLLIKAKMDLLLDMKCMLDLKHIPRLDYAHPCSHETCCESGAGNGALCIGALTTLSMLEKDEYIAAHYPALTQAIKSMAAVSVRHMGTMAGNICNASPAADSILPAICYGAMLTLVSAAGGRVVAAEDFCLAPGSSVRQKNELLTNISLPAPAENTGCCFLKKSRVRADIAKISICAVLSREGEVVRDCRIALGAVAPVPLFLRDISASLIGKRLIRELIADTAREIAAAIRPIDDLRSTAEYRREIAQVLAEEALSQAWINAGGELR